MADDLLALTSATVSVVIPARNAERTLPSVLEPLRSLPAGWDVCLVDDHSTDTTPDIAASFGARVLPSRGSRNDSVARDTGVDATSGEILVFLDADIVVDPSKLIEAIARVEQGEAVCVFAVYNRGNELPGLVTRFKNFWIRHSTLEATRPLHWINTSVAVMRRSAYLGAGRFDAVFSRGRGGGDLDFGRRLTEGAGPIVAGDDFTVTHMKRFTLRGLLWNDFNRARGWLRLALHRRGVPRVLREPSYANVSARFSLGAVLAGIAVASLAVSIFFPAALLVTAAALLAHPFMSWGFLTAARRERIRGWPLFPWLLWLDQLACAAGLAAEVAARALGRPHPHRARTPGMPRAFLWVVAAMMAAAVLAPASNNHLWGINLWSLWPWPWRITALAAGLAVAFLPVLRSRKVPLHILCVIGVLAMWLLLPARSLLFGDGADFSKAAIDPDWLPPRSPLYAFLAKTLLRAVPGDRFVTALGWIATTSGILFLLVAALRGRRIGLPAVLLGGYLAIFGRYVESYALFVTALSAYCVLLTKPASTWRTAVIVLLQGLAVVSHTLGVVLVPVTLGVVLGPRPTRRRLLWPLTAAAVLFLAAFALRGRFPYLDPFRIASLPLAVFGNAFTEQPWTSKTGVFEVRQLVDVVNGFVLAAAPAVLFLFGLVFVPEGRDVLRKTLRSALGAAALLFLLARAFTSTWLGPVLDWDLYAVFSLPWVFVAYHAWSSSALEATRRQTGPALAALGWVLLLPWALTLHTPDASRRRLETYLSGDPAPRPYYASVVAHRLGDARALEGDPSKAAGWFRRAYDLYPRDVYPRREGQAWIDAKQSDKAIEALTRALALNPADRVSLELRAQIHIDRGEMDLAEADYRALLASDPEDPNGHFGLAEVASRRGDDAQWRKRLETAIPAFRKLLASDPRSLAHRRRLVLALLGLERHAEALVEVERILEGFPGSSADWYHLGLCRYVLHRPAEAANALQRAMQLQGDDARVLNLYALAALDSGDPGTALALFTRLIALEDNARYRTGRAGALLKLGRVDEAKTDLERALELDPSYEPGRRLLESLIQMPR